MPLTDDLRRELLKSLLAKLGTDPVKDEALARLILTAAGTKLDGRLEREAAALDETLADTETALAVQRDDIATKRAEFAAAGVGTALDRKSVV